MSNERNFVISWDAPIKPSKSMAGIPIGLDVKELDSLLTNYLDSCNKNVYVFHNSPALTLGSSIDSEGNGVYMFTLYDRSLTNIKIDAQLRDDFYSRALCVLLRRYKVFAVKAWAFERLNSDGDLPVNSYRGKTRENLGLYSKVSEFLDYTNLEFDEGEEWFYTDKEYGGLEVIGYGMSLDNYPEQLVMSIGVIPESAYQL